MSKETMVYIFSFDSKSGVFTLTSSKDQLTINSKHKKYEWLKGQEAGRIIKISDKGRWTSSNDYDNFYQIIKPIKKAEKKLTSSKNTNEKAGVYCFSFIENEFVLTDQNGDEIKITSKHKKFEWLQSQDSGRVIKISEKGRWNSSNDYDGLYDKIKSSKKKASQSVSKPTTQKPKSDNSDEINKLKSDLSELKKVNNKLSEELSALMKKNDAKPFQIVFEVNSDMLKEKDYDSILVDLQNKDGSRITSMQYYRNLEAEWQIVDHMIALKRPDKIKFWAHSKSRGWAESVEIIPNSDGLDYEGLRGVKIYYSDKAKKSQEYLKSRVNYLEQQIKSLKSKTLPDSKPKATKKVEKIVVWEYWRIEFMATESYTYGGRKSKNERTITLKTEKLEEKPTQSYAKALLRQHIANKFKKYPIRWVGGISDTYLVLASDYKLTNITILSIKEW